MSTLINGNSQRMSYSLVVSTETKVKCSVLEAMQFLHTLNSCLLISCFICFRLSSNASIVAQKVGFN